MEKHRTLFVTQRQLFHQNEAIKVAPPELEIIMKPDPSRQELLDVLPDVEFFISERSGQIDAEMIAAAKNLRLIQRLGSQTYDIDLDAARKAGVAVCYRPIPMVANVAEHMLMGMLALARRVREMHHICTQADDWGTPPRKSSEDVFVVNWSKRRNLLSIQRSTVGIVGFGEIGVELTKRLRGFDCTVLYHKRSRLPDFAEQDYTIQYTALDELLARSDFVCSLVPYASDTAGMVNREFIDKMKPGACIIHAGASGVIHDQDAADALVDGRLYGLAMDTFSWEPINPDNPLLPLARKPDSNVILTPHTAVGNLPPELSGRDKDYGNLLHVLNGEPLDYQLV